MFDNTRSKKTNTLRRVPECSNLVRELNYALNVEEKESKDIELIENLELRDVVLEIPARVKIPQLKVNFSEEEKVGLNQYRLMAPRREIKKEPSEFKIPISNGYRIGMGIKYEYNNRV